MEHIQNYASKHDLRLVDLTPHLEESRFRWSLRTSQANSMHLQVLTKSKQHQLKYIKVQAGDRRLPVCLTISDKLKHESYVIIGINKSVHLTTEEINQEKLINLFDRSCDCCICGSQCDNSNFLLMDFQCHFCTAKTCFQCVYQLVKSNETNLDFQALCPICRQYNKILDDIIRIWQKEGYEKINSKIRSKMDKNSRRKMDARLVNEWAQMKMD